MSSHFISTRAKPSASFSLVSSMSKQRRAPAHVPPHVPTQNHRSAHLLLPVVWQGQVVVSTLGLLVVIHEGVEIRKVAVQIDFSEVSPAHQVPIEFRPLWTHRQNWFQGEIMFRLLFPLERVKFQAFYAPRCRFQSPGLQRNLQLSFHQLSWKLQFFPNSFKKNIETMQTRDASKPREWNWISSEIFLGWKRAYWCWQIAGKTPSLNANEAQLLLWQMFWL